MIDAQIFEKLLELPATDRLAIAEALWDSLSADAASVPVPDWHRPLLDQRLDEDEADTGSGESWDEVRRRIEGAG